MSVIPVFRTIFATVGLVLAVDLAHAGERVPIKITNNGTDDILVTVYDMNTQPRSKLLDHQRINGFASVPISVAPDSTGKGHIAWRAVTVDPQLRQCGNRDKPGLSNDDSVHVYAHLQCAPPRARRTTS